MLDSLHKHLFISRVYSVHVLRRFVMNHLMEVSINCHKIINGFKKDIAVGLCFVYICTGLNMPYIT